MTDTDGISDPGPDPIPAPADEGPEVTYPGAPAVLIRQWSLRRKRMTFAAGEGLPPADVDLAPLMQTMIPTGDPGPRDKLSLHGLKLRKMRVELAGRPELAALNAILIAHLRKHGHPPQAPGLFLRIWKEQGQALMPHLPGRWLISSVITFADHGETEAQRRVGLSMSVLLSLMKLYEYERLHAGLDPELPQVGRRPAGKRLPLGMPDFALIAGGLDINLLAPIWQEAKAEPVAGPLACHLLRQLNQDPGNLFRRIGLMRAGVHLDRLDAVLGHKDPG